MLSTVRKHLNTCARLGLYVFVTCFNTFLDVFQCVVTDDTYGPLVDTIKQYPWIPCPHQPHVDFLSTNDKWHHRTRGVAVIALIGVFFFFVPSQTMMWFSVIGWSVIVRADLLMWDSNLVSCSLCSSHPSCCRHPSCVQPAGLSSSPFPTRWGQWPEFLISRTICPGHPPGWSTVSTYPLGRNPSISGDDLPLDLPLEMFLPCQQLLSLRCFLSLTFSCMLFTPSSFLMSTLFTLSLSVTPFILLNILISVFSRICSSFFLTVQHSAPHRSTGLMTVM